MTLASVPDAHDAKYLVSASTDGLVQVWDTGFLLTTGSSAKVNCAEDLAERALLASATLSDGHRVTCLSGERSCWNKTDIDNALKACGSMKDSKLDKKKRKRITFEETTDATVQSAKKKSKKRSKKDVKSKTEEPIEDMANSKIDKKKKKAALWGARLGRKGNRRK